MKTNSLAFRLFATAAAWVVLVLPIAGAIIYSLYRQEVETSFDRRISRAAHRRAFRQHRPRRERGAGRPQGRRRAAVRDHPFRLVLADQAARPEARQVARLPLAGGCLHLRCRASSTSSPTTARCAGPTSTARSSRGARRRDRLRVRRGQAGPALLGCRCRHAGARWKRACAASAPASLWRSPLAGVGLVAVTLFQIRFGLLPPAQGGEGARRHPLRRGGPPRRRRCRRRSSRCSTS